MAIIQGHAMQSSSRGFYPKTLNGSLRFNSGDAPYLSYTNGTATNGKKCTLSFWIKKNEIAGSPLDPAPRFMFAYSGTGNQFHSQWGDGVTGSGDQWVISPGEQSSNQGARMTDASLRDPSAWYHCVWKYNSESGSEESTLYINGVQQSSSSYTTAPVTNQVTSLTKSGTEVKIGYINSSTPDFQLAELFILDGQSLGADSFGETKNGVWVPKNVTATDFTMGNNGVHLTFEDDATVEAFNTVLYKAPTYNTEYDVSGFGFTPDLLWIKNTDNSERHFLFDSVRGVDTSKALVSNSTAVEGLNGISGTTISLNSDGFTINESSYTVGELSYNGRKYVAWGWEAGGSSNTYNVNGTGYASMTAAGLTDGTIATTGLSVNTTTGFSITGWTGNSGAGGTVAHGLGATPNFIIVKDRDGAQNWVVWHDSINSNGNQYLELNSTQPIQSSSVFWNSTAPDSSNFSVGSSNSFGTRRFIAYCWAEKSGYSKFGSYSGSTSEVTVYTTDDGTSGGTNPFKPSLVIIKRTDSDPTSDGYWVMFDTTRDVEGDNGRHLLANLTATESDSSSRKITFNSNGFTVVAEASADDSVNAGSSSTYIYAAFADTRDAAFWLDQSSNNNDWQPVNLDHNDTLLDSPTDNYATWNPIGNVYGNVYAGTFSEGNLRHATSGNPSHVFATMALPSSGKTYWECTPSSIDTARTYVGVVDPTDGATSSSTSSYGFYSKAVLSRDGSLWSSSTSTHDAIYTSYTNGDTIMLAWDGDTGKLWFGKNGTWMNSGNPSAGTGQIVTLDTSKTWLPYAGYNSTWEVNFGQQPFTYTPPA